MTSERFWARTDSSQTRDATHPEMTLHHWQKHTTLCWIAEAGVTEGWSACWLVPVAPSIAHIVASTARLSRSSESNATILKHGSTVVAMHSSLSAKTSPSLKDYRYSVNFQGTSCELLRRWTSSCWIAYGFESNLKVNLTERLKYWSGLSEQYTTACQMDHSSRRRRDYVTGN